MKENEVGRACGTEKSVHGLVGKPEQKRPLGRLRCGVDSVGSE
jgi:hypothetical protein